ncbi:MAG: Dabb family protein [Bacteroidota bacterium]
MKRTFYISLVLILFFASCKTEESVKEYQLAHHVFVWLKNSGSKTDLQQLLEGMKTLKEIEVVNYIQVGVPADTEIREVVDHSYDASLLLFFDNEADQKIYQEHPVHLDFVEKHKKLWSKVIVYDTKAP